MIYRFSQSWIVITLLACCFGVVGEAAEVVTLDQAIESATAHNRRIVSAKLAVDRAKLDIDVAKARRLPVFSVSLLASQSLSRSGLTLERGVLGTYANVGAIPGTTTTLTVPRRPSAILLASASQPLSQQYRISLGIQMAQISKSAATEAERRDKLDLAQEVRTRYYAIQQLQSRRTSLETTRTFLQRLRTEVENNVAQRTALSSDLSAVKVQVAEVDLALAKLIEPLETQHAELNYLMGRDPDDVWDLAPVSSPDGASRDLADLYADALQRRPELRLAELEMTRADLDARSKNAERIPDVSLAVTSFHTGNLGAALPSNLVFAGFQVTWDVFGWGRKRTEVREKLLAKQQAELTRADVAARIKVDVARHQRRVAEARAEVTVAVTVREAAADALRIISNRYEQRDALLSDLLKAQSSVADADTRMATAMLTLATAQAELQRSLGE